MTPDLLLLALLAFCFVLLEGFFSGSETAIISSDRAVLRAESRRGNRRATLAWQHLSKSERLLSTTLVGTNLAAVTATSIATLILSHFVPYEWESAATTAIMAPLILIFGEIVPKSIARAHPERIALRVARPLRTVQRAMHPVVVLVGRIAHGLLALVGSRPSSRSPYVTREELIALARLGEQHGVFMSDERRMIQSVLELRQRPVASLMVPLERVVSVPLGATVGELEAAAGRSGYSRFPVYDGAPDNLVGIVSVVDVFRPDLPGATALAPFVQRDVTVVPPTEPVANLLRDLLYSPTPMAFVRGDGGRVVGMVTAQDLVGGIIGQIRDERHDGASDLIARGRLVFECDGDARVEQLTELTGLAIRKEGFSTVGGLVLKLCGRVPQPGDVVDFGPFHVEVLEASPRRVKRLRFTRTRGNSPTADRP
jgi:CBS domain containing-hemolysin-like protein